MISCSGCSFSCCRPMCTCPSAGLLHAPGGLSCVRILCLDCFVNHVPVLLCAATALFVLPYCLPCLLGSPQCHLLSSLRTTWCSSVPEAAFLVFPEHFGAPPGRAWGCSSLVFGLRAFPLHGVACLLPMCANCSSVLQCAPCAFSFCVATLCLHCLSVSVPGLLCGCVLFLAPTSSMHPVLSLLLFHLLKADPGPSCVRLALCAACRCSTSPETRTRLAWHLWLGPARCPWPGTGRRGLPGRVYHRRQR